MAGKVVDRGGREWGVSKMRKNGEGKREDKREREKRMRKMKIFGEILIL